MTRTRDNKIKWEYIILVLIIIIGFSVRFYDLYEDYPFRGNDAPFFSTFSIRMSNLDNPVQSFLELMNFRWGAVTPLLLSINLFLSNILGLVITEKLTALPMVIIGTLTIFIIYLLGKELKNKYVGLISASFLAILPLHVAQSRNTCGIGVIGPFILCLTIYLLIKYFYNGKYGFWASLLLSFYLISTSLFGGLILLIPFIVFLSSVNNNNRNNSHNTKPWRSKWNLRSLSENLLLTIKRIFKIKSFILPILFLIVPVVSFIIFLFYGLKDFGYIGHILHRTGGGLGFYIITLFTDFVTNYGIYLVILLIIAIIYNIKRLVYLEKDTIILIWAAIYIAPFLFLIRPNMTIVSTYLNSMVIPLIILMSIFVYNVIKYLSDEQNKNKRNKNKKNRNYKNKNDKNKNRNIILKTTKYCFILIIIIIYVLTFITMTGTVHRTPEGYHSLQGSTYQNSGAKTAGYFIRENYKDFNNGDDGKNIKIFTDLNPATAHYYFNTPVISSIEKEGMELFLYFYSISEEADLIIIKEENKEFIRPFLNEFNEFIEIRSKGKTVMHMYHRNMTKSKVSVLDTEDYDKLFDNKYGNIKSLNFGIETQIKHNSKLNDSLKRLENSFFGFIFK